MNKGEVMSIEPSDPEISALSTLSLLETRLRRIEFLLTGASDHDGIPTTRGILTPLTPSSPRPPPFSHLHSTISSRDTVVGRIQQLHDDLNKLRKLSGPVGDLIRDVEHLHAQTPEIFTESTAAAATTTTATTTTTTTTTGPSASASSFSSKPSTSSLSESTSHVFAHTSLYTETASRLSSLQTLAVPPAEQSNGLVELRPRLDAARTRQEVLEGRARELRDRSVRCLEWWVRFGLVGMGELWTDWEERVREAERDLSRLTRVRSDRQGYL